MNNEGLGDFGVAGWIIPAALLGGMYLLVRKSGGGSLSSFSGDEQRYHVVVINDKTGKKVRTTRHAEPLRPAQTILSKQTRRKATRNTIEAEYLWPKDCWEKKHGECL